MAGSNTISVLNELTQAYELVRKFRDELQQPSQIVQSRINVEEIMFSVERAICLIKSQFCTVRDEYGDNQQMIKKRKMLPTWTCQVAASTLRGYEGLPYDGYNWRKYGQKDILNAKHPRAYYRCSHSKKQCCLAMKQVQISDDNPSIFEVTYRGSHTCSNIENHPHQILLDQQNNDISMLKTERLVFETQDSTSYIPLNHEEDLLCSSTNLASCFPALLSPTTSESNCILRTEEMDAYFSIETSNCFEWNSAE